MRIPTALVIAAALAACGSTTGPSSSPGALENAPPDSAVVRPNKLLRPAVFRCGSAGNELRVKGCDLPMEYALGKLDPRFRLSRAQALSALQSAVGYWESATGKSMFRYAPSSLFKINFVYDERQEMFGSSKAGSLGEIRQRHRALVAERTRLLADYRQRRDAYQAKVTHWNSQGGAPPEVQKQLRAERGDLARRLRDANAMVPRINALVGKINAGGRGFNGRISTGITRRRSRAGTTIGLVIDIFAFRSPRHLTLVIAHELGHAMGMSHVGTPQSIMYPVQGPQTHTRPSPQDVGELHRVCKL
jgi:hypothetical protein